MVMLSQARGNARSYAVIWDSDSLACGVAVLSSYNAATVWLAPAAVGLTPDPVAVAVQVRAIAGLTNPDRCSACGAGLSTICKTSCATRIAARAAMRRGQAVHSRVCVRDIWRFRSSAVAVVVASLPVDMTPIRVEATAVRLSSSR